MANLRQELPPPHPPSPQLKFCTPSFVSDRFPCVYLTPGRSLLMRLGRYTRGKSQACRNNKLLGFPHGSDSEVQSLSFYTLLRIFQMEKIAIKEYLTDVKTRSSEDNRLVAACFSENSSHQENKTLTLEIPINWISLVEGVWPKKLIECKPKVNLISGKQCEIFIGNSSNILIKFLPGLLKAHIWYKFTIFTWTKFC